MIKQAQLGHLTEAKTNVLFPIYNDYSLCQRVTNSFGYELDKDVNKEYGKITVIHTLGKLEAKKFVFVGLGDRDKMTKEKLSKAISKAALAMEEREFIVALNHAKYEILTDKEIVSLATHAVYNALYTYLDKKDFNVDFHYRSDITALIEEAIVVANSVNTAKDLVNSPSNLMTPLDLEAHCLKVAKDLDIEITSYDNEALQEMGAGGILAVNQGSDKPARLIVMKYEGNPGAPYTAYVGKGITFDTGGYNLKPSKSMTTMKTDMGGAAAVISAFEAIVKLKKEVNLYAIVATTENMINGSAYKSDDVLTMMNGKTVEITNTDAEGRIVLADALTLADNLKAEKVVDVATLTGACVVALGSEFTGVFANNEQYVQNLISAAEKANEPVWRLPLSDNVSESLAETKVADIVNSTGKQPGATVAAAFLQEFVGKEQAWIHLDIAGTSNGEPGATGVMVKTLVELA